MVRRSVARTGFTLVELLVVIAIIGVLVALLLPAVQAAREAARRSDCSNKLKQIGIALHNFHDVNNSFPPGMLDDDTNTFGWSVPILPYLEQKPMYDQIDTIVNSFAPNGTNPKPVLILKTYPSHPNVDNWATVTAPNTQQPWRMDNVPTQPISKTFLGSFFCPSNAFPRTDNDGYATSTYCGNVGNQRVSFGSNTAAGGPNWSGCATVKAANQNGWFNHDNDNSVTVCQDMAAIQDGTSNTLMVGEVGPSVNVSPTITNNANFPVWIGGNNNGGCQGWFMGSHLRFAGGLFNANGTVTMNLEFYINNRTVGVNTNPHESDLCFGSYHPGGAQFAMGDGSVRFIPQTVNYVVYTALGGRNDGVPFQLP
jgi:prepilin-type N-terminal cleavage/methylation domain-containing protein/prepilin-type processing-associated H-X9-DG protein